MTARAYAQVVVSGADARTFLQGQLSNDLERLDREPRLLAAWCNPKGRVICVPRVDRVAGAYRLAIPDDLAETVVRRLEIFRFRAKVTFAIGPADPGLLTGGNHDGFDFADWQRSNLERGIPEIAALQSEQFTPHMLNLDRLDALSLSKGCYTGQEIVARTHYRGATKRRMLRYESNSPVPAGAEITADDRKVGVVVNAIGTGLLAVLTLDLANADLSIGDARLTRVSLPYGFD